MTPIYVWVGICLIVAVMGSFITTPAIDGWYTTLRRPAIAPPNWIFAPVWTTLYVLMGIAAGLVYRSRDSDSRVGPAMTWFQLQLVLNLLWSYLFFRAHLVGLALIELALLIVALLITVVLFGQIHRLAGWLLWPYLAWCCFAFALNFEFWRLNH